MKHAKLFVLLLMSIQFSACKLLYVPNQPQVPLMSEGDETQVALGMGTNGYGLQLAYSPYYHWLIMGNGNTFTTVEDIDFEVKYRHTYGELGTGYYTRLSKYLRAEGIVGIGGGSSGITDDRHLYRKAFFQPSIGVSGRFIDAGITPRLAWVQHFEDREDGIRRRVNESAVFLEPALTARAGWEQVKFQFQAGMAFSLTPTNLNYRSKFVGMGIHIILVKDFDKYKY